jgi:hypothetical protein
MAGSDEQMSIPKNLLIMQKLMVVLLAYQITHLNKIKGLDWYLTLL